jgi:two-component sensor histidine kinase
MSAPLDHKERTLTVALSMVLLGGIAAAVWAYGRIEARRELLIGSFLSGQDQAFHARLDGFFLGIEDQLEEEAAWLQPFTTRNSQELFTRWDPLLSAYPSIQRISLADQWGNETTLARNGNSLVERSVFKGSLEGPAIESFRTAREGSYDSLRLGADSHDPRQETWFVRALEDNQGRPTWNPSPGDGKGSVMQVSRVIRPPGDSLPLHVLMMEVTPSDSRWMDTYTLGHGTLNGILFDSGRKLLGHTRTSTLIPDVSTAQELLDSGFDLDMGSVFALRFRDRPIYAEVKEHALNGSILYTLLVIEPRFVDSWVNDERVALIAATVVLVLVGILMIWLAVAGSKRNERAKHTARRLRSTERKLAKTSGERDVLNREVHHRVKNNLQVVSSLLNLQASRLDAGPVRSEFLRGKRRIDIIALVHHRMYDQKDLRNVDLQQFFGQLITALARMHEPLRRSVSHDVRASGIKADQDTAIELGIILCELVTNAHEHAFPHATGGHVDITLQAVDSDLHRLLVKDNGVGIRSDRVDREGKLGLEIVEALAEQMNGSMHAHSSESGATFEVLFRMNWNRSGHDIADAEGTEQSTAGPEQR